MFTFLQGYRTYICAGAGAIVVFLQLTGHINPSDANTLFILLGFGGLASIRAGIGSVKGR